MARVKLTTPDGKSCIVDFSLIENVVLNRGNLKIVTARTIYKPGEYPRKEPIINEVRENLQEILAKIDEYEQENGISLLKAKRLLRMAKEE